MPQHSQSTSSTWKRHGRIKSFCIICVLVLLVWQAIDLGQSQFIGSQGWASVLYSPNSTTSTAKDAQGILSGLNHHALNQAHSVKQAELTPQAYINLITSKLSLDQKLGQMMMVQFVGASYTQPLSTMLNQYQVGSVLLFSANGNIIDKTQFKALIQEIHRSATNLPISLAIDQEGGTVDRLQQLDGSRPSAAALGASNNLQKVKAAGRQDAQDLSSYGITLNLAPVVDVDNSVYSEMHRDMRTFGTTPATVSRMAEAYLEGLQQSHKVVGTLKHFPGLGDATADPHVGLPSIQRSRNELETIDWAPYRNLIQQSQAHAIMVTHEIVPAIDSSQPSSLSPKLVTGILRNEMGFQGVIMTDSLTMAGVTAYYTPDQAAALAIEAGSDIIMGASSPGEVVQMLNGIKQALNSGAIQLSRIDASVRRILLMKYQMGLLSIPGSK
ncbi:glycoside hydrolase family 3 protein [Dictyobacter formicarum]